VNTRIRWFQTIAVVVIVCHFLAAASLAETISASDPCDYADQIGSESLKEPVSDLRLESDVSVDGGPRPIRFDRGGVAASFRGMFFLCYRFSFLKAFLIHAPPAVA